MDEEFLLWIRHLEKSSQEIAELKIRDKSALVTHLVEGSFLFIFSELVTNCKKAISPTYDKPATVVQREANLKKAISYLVQNKAIRSDHLWRTKQLAKRDIKYIRELLIDLMSSYRHTKKDEGQ